MYSQELIQTIRARSDIVSVISQHVVLTHKGTKYWGKCPFHQEKTPSFSVSPDKQFFYCFGCQAGGNVITFLMKIENIDFIEAIRKLANQAGIALPEDEKTPEQLQQDRERQDVLKANELACQFFQVCLTKWGGGIQAREYLQKRGISHASVEQFRLGYAPADWRSLIMALRKKGISLETLVKAGLALQGKSQTHYDRFRNRVIFPIIDINGNVIAFGGRVLDDSHPKYLNTSDTLVFNKRHLLYGLYTAQHDIRKSGRAIIVEGYIDVVTAQQNGVREVVASLGTAFTAEQAKLLLRHTHNIIIAYDTDTAGQGATFRGIEILSQFGGTIRVLDLPQGKDPDEFIRTQGVDAFRDQLDTASSYVDYIVEKTIIANDTMDLQGKLAVVNKVLPIFAGLKREVELTSHLQNLAQRLAIDESALRRELNRYLRKNKLVKIEKNGNNIFNDTTLLVTSKGAEREAEREVIRIMLEKPQWIPAISDKLQPSDFLDVTHRYIAEVLCQHWQKDATIESQTVMLSLPQKAQQIMAEILSIEKRYSDQERQQALDDCINKIKMARIDQKVKEKQQLVDQLLQRGDQKYQDILAEILDLTQQKTKI